MTEQKQEGVVELVVIDVAVPAPLARAALAQTGDAPGRVDSPPTSTIAAPATVMSTPTCAAAPGSPTCLPPSEKLSGVTLRMPITCG